MAWNIYDELSSEEITEMFAASMVWYDKAPPEVRALVREYSAWPVRDALTRSGGNITRAARILAAENR